MAARFVPIGNEAMWQRVEHWLLSGWRARRVLVLHGPVGSGKTFGIHRLAQQNGMNVFEQNASHRRDAASLEDAVAKIGNRSFDARRTLVLIDECETVDKAAIEALVRMYTTKVEDALPPMICICHNYWDQTLRALHRIVPPKDAIQLRAVPPAAMVRHRSALGVKCEHEKVQQVAESVQGDLRQFCIRVSMGSGVDERCADVFEKARLIMGPSVDSDFRHKQFQSDEFISTAMLFENYPTNRGACPVGDIADTLSWADTQRCMGQLTDEASYVLANRVHNDNQWMRPKFPTEWMAMERKRGKRKLDLDRSIWG